MRIIKLFCCAGMSTSLLVNKMKAYAASINYECEISAYSVGQAKAQGEDADVILIGPQVQYEKKRVQGYFPDKPVAVMDMRAYGLMDGKAMVEMCKKLLGD